MSIFKKGFSSLILIGKSWKTHPENFSKFQFPGNEPDGSTCKLIQTAWKSAACFMRQMIYDFMGRRPLRNLVLIFKLNNFES